MVDKMIEATPGNEIPKLIEEADQLFSDQKFEESLKLFESLVGMDPGNPRIIAGMLRCLIQIKRFDDANEMFDSFDEKILENDEIIKIKKLLEFFDLLGFNDPNVTEARKKISSMMFK